ncbi:MAG: hypothetical protein SGI83_04995 [Bacteroidota bacterium]|nr:hypothetical protein [Bacteroidota bacterium]
MNKLFFLTLSGIILLACNNDKKNSSSETKSETPVSSEKTPASGDNRIVFTVDGKLVETTGWNIGYFDFGTGGGKQINITSNMNEEPRTVNFNINGDKAGTYAISSGLDAQRPGIAYGSYTPDYKKDMLNVYSFESGELIIESIDAGNKTLNASFHAVAKNTKGETVTITDGKVINGKLKL